MFIATLKPVSVLLIYIILGYIITRVKLIDKSASKLLSVLLTYIIAPVYSVVNLSVNFDIQKLSEYLVLFLSGIVVVGLCIAVSLPIAKFFGKNKLSGAIYKYVFAFSNNGYFGNPLVLAVFGEQALVKYMIFVLATNIAISSYGYYILTTAKEDGGESGKAKIKWSAIFSPPLIGTLLGIVLAVLPFTMPGFFYEILKPASDCYSAIAMLVVGIVLGSSTLKQLFSSGKSYLVGIIRLIGLPVLFGAVCYLSSLIGLPKDVCVFTLILVSLPAGMNCVVYPESVGLDSTEAANSCFISYVMSLATIPLVFTLMTTLFGSVI